jgi:cytochrome c biogenesis protein CcdA
MSTDASARPAFSVLRYGKSAGVGAAFAVGWTPCIGPILGAILALAATSGGVVKGSLLLAAWSAGLGIPFLITGLAMGQVMTGLRKIRPAMPVIEVIGGSIVILVGVLIFMDQFTVFNQYFTGASDLVIGAEGSVDGVGINGPLGFVAAFIAGIIAFLSPCCLPLVPAYIAHLAGLTGETDRFESHRATTFKHSLAFVGGFSIIFVLLGASVGAVGFVVQNNLRLLEQIAGVLLVVLGLNLIGVIRIPFLYRTYSLGSGV